MKACIVNYFDTNKCVVPLDYIFRPCVSPPPGIESRPGRNPGKQTCSREAHILAPQRSSRLRERVQNEVLDAQIHNLLLLHPVRRESGIHARNLRMIMAHRRREVSGAGARAMCCERSARRRTAQDALHANGTLDQSRPWRGGSNTAPLARSSRVMAAFSSMPWLSPLQRTTQPRGPSAASGPSKHTRSSPRKPSLAA